jgi:hypothetical protein
MGQVIAMRGRPSRSRLLDLQEQIDDNRDELTAHNAEALGLVEAARPLVNGLEIVAREVGPSALALARSLGSLLASYETRHLPHDPTPVPLEALAA